MIIFLSGTDSKVRDEAIRVRNSLGVMRRRLGSEDIGELDHYVNAQTLFDKEISVVTLEDVFRGDASKAKEIVPKLKESTTIFFIDEPFASDAVIKSISPHATNIFRAKIEEKEKSQFPFALCNAIAKRDKKTAWVSYLEYREGDLEMLHGALWWQWKKLFEIKSPYTKEELEEKGAELIATFHRAHKGEARFGDELERWVLGL